MKKDYQKFISEIIKDRIIYRVVNTAMNEELLKNCPHIDILDLAIIFQLVVISHESEQITIQIDNAHLKSWGLEIEQLKELAEINTRQMFPEDIISIADIVKCLSNQFADEDVLETMSVEDDEIFYVLTNKKKSYGAVVIFYEGVLKRIANKLCSNLLILPLNIHESILLKETVKTNYNHLKKIIKEFTEKMIVREEFLSEHIYRYNREKEALEIVE